MTTWSDRRARFRALLAGSECVHPASVFDAISARIAEELGFQAGIFSGSVASQVILGAPDLVLVTLSEFVEQLRRIARGSELPILVDADHGYGNALNVMRAVEELEAAGVAALMIEDTVLPRPFGSDGRALISIEEGRRKMAAAVAARRDSQLVVLARTTIGLSDDFGDTLARVDAYQATGVDGIFLAGLATRTQLDAIAQVTRLPLVTGGIRPELADPAYLSARGVKICLLGHQPIQAGYQAVYDCLKAMKEGARSSELPGVPTAQQFARWLRSDAYNALTKRYLDGL
ncbi:MAG TPA: isocitrate lyase/phosphoenolpyruvate mutase family protein [Beijerinckiaceae bacterium]|nr:isocitrate lyase/phosphoenolpyruvate mutase family protein [Beijerinckiaceae bacterium]